MSLLLPFLMVVACAPSPIEPEVGAISWFDQAQKQIAAGEYQAHPEGDGFRLFNRAQRLQAHLGPDGLHVQPQTGSDAVHLTLKAWGREDRQEFSKEVRPEAGDCVGGGQVDAKGQCLRRLAYVRAGLTEWWQNQSEGLEQGFTVAEVPDGSGMLVFDLSVTGAEVVVDGDVALLKRSWGESLQLSELSAQDQEGHPLPTGMETTSDGLRLWVDPQNAVGVITVDPMLTTIATTYEGNQSDAAFGLSVASAGDVNGDGYDDVIVGANGYDNGQVDEGAAFIYLGSKTGLPSSASVTLEPNKSNSGFGVSVASAGDVNKDGYGDVVIGARDYSNGQFSEGAAYVYMGSASGLSTSAAVSMESNRTNAYFGVSVASAGDVNGDGYGDVLVGASGYDGGQSNEGGAFVYLGSSSGLSSTSSLTLESNVVNAYFGISVASAGDVNKDGYGDVVIGAYGYANGQNYEGAAFVYLGASTGLSSTAATSLESNQDSGFMGRSVASAGDVNGDGYGDLIVGVHGYDNGQVDEGQARVYLGSSTGISSSAASTFESNVQSVSFGNSVAGAGDINGDGYDDVVVGCYRCTNGQSSEGSAFVYLGSSSGLSTTATATLEINQALAQFGSSVAGAGDINGDGFDDLIIGANAYTNGQSAEGAAFVYLGSSDKLYADADGDGYGDLTQPGTGTGYVANASDCNDTNAAVSPGATEVCDTASTDEDCDGLIDDADPSATGKTTFFLDSDADGYGGSSSTQACVQPVGSVSNALDCNDNDANISPADAEICDAANIDEDCDGLVDDADGSATGQSSFYQDSDGDSYGTGSPVQACDSASGTVQVNGDCNDTNAGISPGAAEVCDAANTDEDCDGLIDDADPSASGKGTFYLDSDGDGTGGTVSVTSCDLSVGYVVPSGDCNDANSSISPGAAEVCDAASADEDCDGLADDADSSVTGKTVFFLDNDGDGYGSSTNLSSCHQPTSYVSNSLDCNDGNAGISPADPEICDAANTDEDCDGLADDADSSATGQSTFYADSDGDGYGSGNATLVCDGATGDVSNNADCDDNKASISPSAIELCDAANTDEDCDGLADDADPSVAGMGTFYLDNDGDGVGGTSTVTSCDLSAGYAASTGDCDDTDAGISPTTAEVCDSHNTDENCDGLADNDDSSATGKTVFYLDNDGDGYGGNTSTEACDRASGYASLTGDCNDNDAAFNPGAAETDCSDPNDYNCDGSTGYADADQDGYSACLDCNDQDPAYNPGATETECTDPNDYNCDGSTGYADADGDGFASCEECDDLNADINPDAAERCNTIDDNCDGDIDGNAVDATVWYDDVDGDGQGNLNASQSACTAPEGTVADNQDCDDNDATIYVGAAEIAGDAIDQDCDGSDLPATSGDSGDGGGKTPPTCGCTTGNPTTSMLAFAAFAVLYFRRRSSCATTKHWQ